MSGRAPLSAGELPASEQYLYDSRTVSLQRRRVAASRVRRRRLLAIDLGIGVALAVAGLILAPGLAILALAALIVLLAVAAWAGGERLLARQRRLRRRQRAARG